MEGNIKTAKSRLFVTNILHSKDETEEKLEKCFNFLSTVVNGLSEKEAHDALNTTVCRGAQQHEELCVGLLFSILIEPTTAMKAYRDLTFITRDGMSLVIGRLIGLISDKFSKLQDTAKTQVVWLTTELVKNSVSGVEGVCHALLRQIIGGDTSPGNVWLAEALLTLFSNNRSWLDKNSVLLATTVYTFVRLLEDHEGASLKNLRQIEIDFCISLLREKFADCMQIGRDLVRLLQHVARIPEFALLWKDMMLKPQSLCPQFTGILQLLTMRTSRKFLVCRLTPDMENKIIFITSKVKFGQQKRYQDWYQKQFLSTPESQTLRPDLIRYIVGVVHPSNEVLCSDIIPRWAIIGWLLTSCQSPVASANSKLALFYDWLFYQRDKDNIMNIEPAILVMYHSIRSHPAITATCLDFLCRLTAKFCPSLATQVKQGVTCSLKIILEKRVVSSLSPLFDNLKMERELRSLIRTTFPDFCNLDQAHKLEESSTSAFNKVESSSSQAEDYLIPGTDTDVGMIDSSGKENETADSGVEEELDMPDEEAVFSDPEEEDYGEGNKKTYNKAKEYEFKPIEKDGVNEEGIEERESNEDITDQLEELEKLESLGDIELKELVMKFFHESDLSMRCVLMESILSSVSSLDDFEDELANALAVCINFCLVDEMLLPCIARDKSTEEMLEEPVYVLFKNICTLPTHDMTRERFLTLLCELHSVEPKFGYRFLFYLKASALDEERLTMYEDFASASREDKSLGDCLVEDLKVCEENDPKVFRYLISSIYKKFSEHVVGSSDVLHMLVTNMEPRQLNQFISEITLGELTIFGKQSLDKLIESTLEWESYEQYFVWQLVQAEDVLLEDFVNILPILDQDLHYEALANMLVLMKNNEPSADLIEPVLTMKCSDKRPGNVFSIPLLRYWSQEYPKETAMLIGQQLNRSLSNSKKRKNQKNQAGLDTVLAHMDWLHKICQEQEDVSFFKHEGLKAALDQVRQAASEARKSRFKMLFSVCEEFDSRKRTTRASRMAAVAPPSSESEEEEETPKSRQSKRRKKTSSGVDSDSDE